GGASSRHSTVPVAPRSHLHRGLRARRAAAVANQSPGHQQRVLGLVRNDAAPPPPPPPPPPSTVVKFVVDRSILHLDADVSEAASAAAAVASLMAKKSGFRSRQLAVRGAAAAQPVERSSGRQGRRAGGGGRQPVAEVEERRVDLDGQRARKEAAGRPDKQQPETRPAVRFTAVGVLTDWSSDLSSGGATGPWQPPIKHHPGTQAKQICSLQQPRLVPPIMLPAPPGNATKAHMNSIRNGIGEMTARISSSTQRGTVTLPQGSCSTSPFHCEPLDRMYLLKKHLGQRCVYRCLYRVTYLVLEDLQTGRAEHGRSNFTHNQQSLTAAAHVAGAGQRRLERSDVAALGAAVERLARGVHEARRAAAQTDHVVPFVIVEISESFQQLLCCCLARLSYALPLSGSAGCAVVNCFDRVLPGLSGGLPAAGGCVYSVGDYSAAHLPTADKTYVTLYKQPPYTHRCPRAASSASYILSSGSHGKAHVLQLPCGSVTVPRWVELLILAVLIGLEAVLQITLIAIKWSSCDSYISADAVPNAVHGAPCGLHCQAGAGSIYSAAHSLGAAASITDPVPLSHRRAVSSTSATAAGRLLCPSSLFGPLDLLESGAGRRVASFADSRHTWARRFHRLLAINEATAAQPPTLPPRRRRLAWACQGPSAWRLTVELAKLSVKQTWLALLAAEGPPTIREDVGLLTLIGRSISWPLRRQLQRRRRQG
uniref:Guanylate cyclase n=1 Tax=Macrostomum lignano TaxID=282301 RepID=A0A1I8F5Z1_9PLAT